MVDPAKMENWEVMVHPSIVASTGSIAVAPLFPLQHFFPGVRISERAEIRTELPGASCPHTAQRTC